MTKTLEEKIREAMKHSYGFKGDTEKTIKELVKIVSHAIQEAEKEFGKELKSQMIHDAFNIDNEAHIRLYDVYKAIDNLLDQKREGKE